MPCSLTLDVGHRVKERLGETALHQRAARPRIAPPGYGAPSMIRNRGLHPRLVAWVIVGAAVPPDDRLRRQLLPRDDTSWLSAIGNVILCDPMRVAFARSARIPQDDDGTARKEGHESADDG